MLLTVDAGNTNITLGLFKEDKVFATFRMNTQMVKTSDEYGSTTVSYTHLTLPTT